MTMTIKNKLYKLEIGSLINTLDCSTAPFPYATTTSYDSVTEMYDVRFSDNSYC